MTKEKIDKRKRYYLMIDTETCPIDRNIKEVLASNMLVYDIGFAVVDRHGKIYKTGSYIVSEIFFGEYETKMQSAYYSQKIPNYFREIGTNERLVKSWSQISFIIRKAIEDYEIDTVVAHNAKFDFGTLQTTKRYLEEYPLLPYLVWYDTLKMSREVLANNKGYRKFCEENNYLTKQGKNRYTAEILYQFITKDMDFKESHTGLEDVKIETLIFAWLMKHYPKKKELFNKEV